MIALLGLPQVQMGETLGVCRIDERGASCWSTRGSPDPALTARVESLVRRSDTNLSFLPQRKNRFLIVQQNVSAALSATSAEGRLSYTMLESREGKSLWAFRIATPIGTSTASVTVKYLLPAGQSVEIPLREESRAKVHDVTVTLGRATPSTNWMSVALPGSYVWHFIVDRSETNPAGDLSFEAIGADGKTIRYVNALGRPVDAARGDELWRQVAAGKWDWRNPPDIMPAQFEHEMGQPLYYATNVDPKVIHRVRIRRLAEQRETIGPFALDPL